MDSGSCVVNSSVPGPPVCGNPVATGSSVSGIFVETAPVLNVTCPPVEGSPGPSVKAVPVIGCSVTGPSVSGMSVSSVVVGASTQPSNEPEY